MATRRAWILQGTSKTASTSVAASTTTGTDFPQVGDILIGFVLADNASASTPIYSSNSSTTLVTINSNTGRTDMSASAGADAQLIVLIGVVPSGASFTSLSSITVALGTSVTARAALWACFQSADSNTPTIVAGPNATTRTTSGGTTGDVNLACVVSADATIPALTAGTTVATFGTTGAGASTNLSARLVEAAGGSAATVGNPTTTGGGVTLIVTNNGGAAPALPPDVVMAPRSW